MRQKSILAISETKELLKKIRKELKDEYEVITFNNFLDGLDMLRESDFDILLLDEFSELYHAEETHLPSVRHNLWMKSVWHDVLPEV